MLVRVRPGAELSAAEREFVDCVRAVPAAGLVLVDVLVDRGGRRLGAVLFTPRGMSVAEIRGFRRRQSGILSVRPDRPWKISGKALDLDAQSHPGEQLEHGVYAVRDTLQRALLDPGQICGVVALLPRRGVVVRPSRTTLRPGFDVVVLNATDTAGLRSYIKKFGGEPGEWDVDRVIGAVDALEMGQDLSRADLREAGFAERPGAAEPRRRLAPVSAGVPGAPGDEAVTEPGLAVAQSVSAHGERVPAPRPERVPSGADPVPAPPEAAPAAASAESRGDFVPEPDQPSDRTPPPYVPPATRFAPPPPGTGAAGTSAPHGDPGPYAPPPGTATGPVTPPPPPPGGTPDPVNPPPPGFGPEPAVPPRGEADPPVPVSDAPVPDARASDGAAPDAPASDGAAPGDAAPGDAAPDGAVPDGAATERQATTSRPERRPYTVPPRVQAAPGSDGEPAAEERVNVPHVDPPEPTRNPRPLQPLPPEELSEPRYSQAAQASQPASTSQVSRTTEDTSATEAAQASQPASATGAASVAGAASAVEAASPASPASVTEAASPASPVSVTEAASAPQGDPSARQAPARPERRPYTVPPRAASGAAGDPAAEERVNVPHVDPPEPTPNPTRLNPLPPEELSEPHRPPEAPPQGGEPGAQAADAPFVPPPTTFAPPPPGEEVPGPSAPQGDSGPYAGGAMPPPDPDRAAYTPPSEPYVPYGAAGPQGGQGPEVPPVDPPGPTQRPSRLNPLPPEAMSAPYRPPGQVAPAPAAPRPSRMRNPLAWLVLLIASLGVLAVVLMVVTATGGSEEGGGSKPTSTTTVVPGTVTVEPTTVPPGPNSCFPFQTDC
ncbi:MAG TPA: hypothetical protein VK083_16585 [Nocardia sp.]|uniref:hypothetical protein n=1 Tax=Nocardia sp. TaxID=1821 RepID=UPI002B4B1D69|nr:hypothetical protein [Nocardia sp.]HLS78400.1 hypothetical protein [Nocardia sp.]